MEKILKLKEEIRSLTEEMKQLVEKRDVQGAKEIRNKIKEKRDLLELEEEIVEEEKRSLKNQQNKRKKDPDVKVNEMRAITKLITGMGELSAEERALISSDKNAAIIPKEFVNQVIELQKGFGSLKEYCDIIPVTKNEGTIPVVDLDQNDLADVEEGKDIVTGDLVTKDVKFKCSKVGLIQEITSETLDDAVLDVETLVRKNFVNIATVKENAKIMKVIADNATEVTGATTYEDVENAMDSSLPSVKNGLMTITNVAGYCLLKNMKDKQGRKLNLITNVNGTEYFNNKPIVTVDDALVKLTEGKKCLFYVLNFKEAVKYLDRKQITIAKSDEAGFENDTSKIRILERFVPELGSARSIKKIEI